MLKTTQNDLVQAAQDLTAGSEAMIWALEQGMITDNDYAKAEEAYDIIWTKVHNLAWDEVGNNSNIK